MKLTFIGADHEVTGSCHLVEACGKNILVDCGMEQGPDLYENQEIPVASGDIDYILLTHAHIDHSGKIPMLCKQGFHGEIVTTFATSDLCNIMLRDSAHIQEFEAEWRNRKARRSGGPEYEPLYTMADADAAIKLLAPCDYDQRITLCDGIDIRFTDVGHLLGSAAIEMWSTEGDISKKIVFSGDVGNLDQPIIKDPKKVTEADYINKNVKSCFDEDALAIIEKGINPLVFPGLKTTITSDESRMINFDTKPKVILSASGMCEAGRIRHHLKHNLWKKESTICFVGYQAVGTLGRKLIEGAECVKLFGETVEVNAKIESLKGISGHADRNGLLDWLSGFENTPQHVFVVHGEDQVTDTFAEAITEKFGWPAMAPYSGGCVDLATGEILSVGIKEPKKAVEKPAQIRKQNAFYRVVAAAKRLLDVVYKNEGLANKELMKFENQINNLADKWDR